MKAGMICVVVLVATLGLGAEAVAEIGHANGKSNVRADTRFHLDGTIGVCKLIPAGPVTMPNSAVYQIAAWSDAETYLKKIKNIDAKFEITAVDVLQQPKHGRLVDNDFFYPESGYTGQDSITFLVEIGGHKVKVVHFIQIIPGIGNESYDRLCPNPYYWKISSTEY